MCKEEQLKEIIWCDEIFQMAHQITHPYCSMIRLILPFETFSQLLEMTEALLEEIIFFSYFKLMPNSVNSRARWTEFEKQKLIALFKSYNIRECFVQIEKITNICVKRRTSRKIKVKKCYFGCSCVSGQIL